MLDVAATFLIGELHISKAQNQLATEKKLRRKKTLQMDNTS